MLRAIRKSRRCGDVPSIIIMPSDSAKDVDAIWIAGATAYFTKPHTLEQFSKQRPSSRRPRWRADRAVRAGNLGSCATKYQRPAVVHDFPDPPPIRIVNLD